MPTALAFALPQPHDPQPSLVSRTGYFPIAKREHTPEEVLQEVVRQDLARIASLRNASEVMHTDHFSPLAGAVRQTFQANPEDARDEDVNADEEEAVTTTTYALPERPVKAPLTPVHRWVHALLPLVMVGAIVALAMAGHA